MKTAVSLPDELFRRGEAAARRLKVSRSQLYANALERFLQEEESSAVTAKLNEVYARNDSSLDPAFREAQLRILRKERW